MTLISIIYSAVSYPERLQFIHASGKEASHHFLLTTEVPSDDLSCLKVIVPTEKISSWRFWLFALKKTKEIILSLDSRDQVIVHEYLSGVTNFMLRISIGNRAKRVTSLYSVELDFLQHGGWRADIYSRPFFSFYQHFIWFRKSLPITIMNAMAWIGSDIIVGNSTAVTDDFKTLFPNKETEVINTSVDINKFKPKKNRTDRTDNIELLFFSRINPPKGLGILLEALLQLRNEGLDFDLNIIGGVWDFEKKWFTKLLDHYQADSYYSVIGQLTHSKLIPYLHGSDVLVFPSYYEGSPRAVKEAMGVGLVCLASDLPGAKMLDPDSEALLFFQKGSLEDLKQQLRRLPAMKQNGELMRRSLKTRNKALLFSREKVCNKQIEMYRRILTSKRVN